jgi:hypothetical protein
MTWDVPVSQTTILEMVKMFTNEALVCEMSADVAKPEVQFGLSFMLTLLCSSMSLLVGSCVTLV